jgi:hypothetical protein
MWFAMRFIKIFWHKTKRWAKVGEFMGSCDTMGERIGRIEQIDTDFFVFCLKSNVDSKKNPFESARSA